jgi:pimeloyl-ACP methyl ester carboxylesterase
MLQVAKVDGILLTRVETNISPGKTCTAALVYCHGFPDSSVTPDAFEEAKQAPDAPPEHGFWASRFPRKVCEHVLGKFSDVAFIAFNSRGIPGSSSGVPPSRVEDPPLDFESKTLSGDMQDIASVTRFAEEQFPGTKIIMCGFSTGAFLALAFTACPEMHPSRGIAACFVLASVSGICCRPFDALRLRYFLLQLLGELGAHEPIKARIWHWLEPVSMRKAFEIFQVAPSPLASSPQKWNSYLSHKRVFNVVLQKSIITQIRQFDFYISIGRRQVDGFVGGCLLQNDVENTFSETSTAARRKKIIWHSVSIKGSRESTLSQNRQLIVY